MTDVHSSSVPLFTMPSNKFYPPHIDESQSLLRADLLNARFPQKSSSKKAVIVEAQAGQGKTTLVSQFLHYLNHDYIWYQIGPEDSDPVLLLSSLLTSCALRFPEFSSPQLSSILDEGEVGPLDLKRCANILLNDLNSFLTHDLYIVFDDLHLIAGRTLTTSLLDYLLDSSPPKLRFILASRHPLEMRSKLLRDGSKISYLNTEDLALDDREIESLYNGVLQKSITRQDALDIYRVTNGWIMGIVLASHPISGRGRFWQQSGTSTLPATTHGHGHMLDYFQDEIFDRIPQELHDPFLQLSFLSEIPVDLATSLTGISEFGTILSEMARDNFFVYHLDDSRFAFRFHHFFQEFLQLRAQQSLAESNIREIHLREAEYYLERNMVEKALASYNKAGDYLTMERLLRDNGMELISRNRTLTILALLDSIEESTLFRHGWLTFYAGILRNDFKPKDTLRYYEKAIDLFIEQGDEEGELVALSQMMYFHFVVSGCYKSGSKLIPRAEYLIKKNEADLSDPVKILAIRNIASGLCFFKGEMEKARLWIVIASKLAARQKSRYFTSSARFIQGYIELFSGNRTKYLREAEICHALLNDPLVSLSHKLSIRVMYLCYQCMMGDPLNFSIHQQAIKETIDKTVVDQTVAAPYLYVWGAIGLFSLGQAEKAMDLLHKGIGISSGDKNEHMLSQLLQWQAYGYAILGENDRVQPMLAESATMRDSAGGRFYQVFHQILAGATLSRIGDYGAAAQSLSEGLRGAQKISSTFLTICAHMQRAFHLVISDDCEAALDDLESGLSLMKTNGYSHFWGWEPEMMHTLLSQAVRFDIEKSFVQMLACEKLRLSFNDHGEAIPLLRFTLLDTFQIHLGEKLVCQAKDLTPSQRELLGLLLTTKGQRISQERIQLDLWPDASPDNARKSFDTLHTRLRKELSKNSGVDIKKYIFIQKGILCLAHYTMDSLRFSEAARKGIVHSKNGDWWQAENAFNLALSYWQGALPEETFKSEQALSHNDQLTDILIELITSWARQMFTTGRVVEAIQLIERFQPIIALEEDLVVLLYALHNRNSAPIKAREVLDRYKSALLNVAYDKEEVEEFIRDAVAAAKELLNGQSTVAIR